ncbi:MAG: BMP family ABC transporter substrate-binding protein [Defluviitaleaceae bacterium]|nr:BMP family ABC transporter substrate-binding protein [Defluviitaleaceae bacterium]
MKNVLKCISLAALIVAVVAVLGACNNQPAPAPAPVEAPVEAEVEVPAEPDPEPEPVEVEEVEAVEEPAPEPEAGFTADDVQIALIAHSPDSILDDGSFNEGAWQGIQLFLSTHGLSGDHAQFFQPHVADDAARIDLIEAAIDGGANVLVLPGFHFESSLYEAQDLFPDTTFILLDASPRRDGVTRVENNVAAIHYAEDQAGFLAGYAAVMEGYRALGFMGGIPVPAVVRFGHGFIQGAEHAAASLGLEAGEVTISYHYLGGFAPDPAHAMAAAAWFADGTQVIFAAAGGAGFNVMSAAEGAGASTIGVDVDQAGLSPSVITSAVKGLDVSVNAMLTAFVEGRFQGGEQLFDASINGVGLPMGSARFENFTTAQYDNVFAQLAGGSVTVSNSLVMDEILPMITLVTVVER